MVALSPVPQPSEPEHERLDYDALFGRNLSYRAYDILELGMGHVYFVGPLNRCLFLSPWTYAKFVFTVRAQRLMDRDEVVILQPLVTERLKDVLTDVLKSEMSEQPRTADLAIDCVRFTVRYYGLGKATMIIPSREDFVLKLKQRVRPPRPPPEPHVEPAVIVDRPRLDEWMEAVLEETTFDDEEQEEAEARLRSDDDDGAGGDDLLDHLLAGDLRLDTDGFEHDVDPAAGTVHAVSEESEEATIRSELAPQLQKQRNQVSVIFCIYTYVCGLLHEQDIIIVIV
jgi:hypothetical protein